MGREELGTTPENGSGIPRQFWAGPVSVFGARALKQIYEFRESIWRNEPSVADVHKFDPASLWDAHDVHGLHWIITVETTIVAAARLCVHHDARELPAYDRIHHLMGDIPAPFASLNQLVVHPSMRRQGLSRALTDIRIEAARSRGARTMISEAAPNRVLGLRDLGFAELGHAAGLPWDLVPFTLMYLNISE